MASGTQRMWDNDASTTPSLWLKLSPEGAYWAQSPLCEEQEYHALDMWRLGGRGQLPYGDGYQLLQKEGSSHVLNGGGGGSWAMKSMKISQQMQKFWNHTSSFRGPSMIHSH